MNNATVVKDSQGNGAHQADVAKRTTRAVNSPLHEQTSGRCVQDNEQKMKERLGDLRKCADIGDQQGVWYYLAKVNDCAILDGKKFPVDEVRDVLGIAAYSMLAKAADYLHDGHPDIARRSLVEANRFAAYANLDISQRIGELEREIEESQRPR